MTGTFEIRPLRTEEERNACVALQKMTWGEELPELVPPALLHVVQRIGGIAAGAFDSSDCLLGFVFGITGLQDGRAVHWSDMLAVRPDYRDRGLGLALKRYQRETLLGRGVETIHWTFDPLESRNAYLNFARLGVTATEYQRNFYGEGASPLHQGIGTDRLIATWRIRSERVRRRLVGEEPGPAAGDVAHLPLVNRLDKAEGEVRSEEPDLALDAERLRIGIPADIQSLKQRDPELALDWRRKTRAAFEGYLGRGYGAAEMVRETDRSFYVLTRTRLAS